MRTRNFSIRSYGERGNIIRLFMVNDDDRGEFGIDSVTVTDYKAEGDSWNLASRSIRKDMRKKAEEDAKVCGYKIVWKRNRDYDR